MYGARRVEEESFCCDFFQNDPHETSRSAREELVLS